MPKNVRVIRQHAFGQCRSLKEVLFPGDSALEEVEAGAFDGTLLRAGDVRFPASAKVLRDVFNVKK